MLFVSILVLSCGLALPLGADEAVNAGDANSKAADGDVRGDEATENELIPIAGDYESARLAAEESKRPLVVVFGAQWCSWCRKLEEELETDAAAAIRRSWVLAKIDVDSDAATARRMNVVSLPAIRIVDGDGRPVASHDGFLTARRFAVWLDEHLDEADPAVLTVLSAEGEPTADEITELAAMLQRRSASIRAAAARRLADHRSATATAVVEVLRSGGLSSRLAAIEILESWNAPVADVDPWVPDTLGDRAFQRLTNWLEGGA